MKIYLVLFILYINLFGSDVCSSLLKKESINYSYALLSFNKNHSTCYEEILKTKNMVVIEDMMSKLLQEKQIYDYDIKEPILILLKEEADFKYINQILSIKNDLSDIKYSIEYLSDKRNLLKSFLENSNLDRNQIFYTINENYDIEKTTDYFIKDSLFSAILSLDNIKYTKEIIEINRNKPNFKKFINVGIKNTIYNPNNFRVFLEETTLYNIFSDPYAYKFISELSLFDEINKLYFLELCSSIFVNIELIFPFHYISYMEYYSKNIIHKNSFFTNPFIFEHSLDNYELLSTIYYFVLIFLFLIFFNIFIKNLIDSFFQVLFFSYQKKYKFKKFNLKKEKLENFKYFFDKSVFLFLKNKFRNIFHLVFFNHKIEIVNSVIKNKYKLNYSLETLKKEGKGSGINFQNKEELLLFGKKEAIKELNNYNNYILLKKKLENFNFGQHKKYFFTIEPNVQNNCICSSCFGSGYHIIETSTTIEYSDGRKEEEFESRRETCSSCNGTGYEHYILKININIEDFDYNIFKISNLNENLKLSILNNIKCKNISLSSETVYQNFVISNNEIIGEAEFNSIYCEAEMKANDIVYHVKTFGDSAEVIDINDFGTNNLSKELDKYIINSDLEYSFLNIFKTRKTENRIKRFFLFNSNRKILENLVETADVKITKINSPFSVSEDYIHKIGLISFVFLDRFKKNYFYHSLITYISLFLICFLYNGISLMFLICFILFSIFYYFLSNMYFKLRLFLLGGNSLILYSKYGIVAANHIRSEIFNKEKK